MAIHIDLVKFGDSILLGPSWRWRYAAGSPWALQRFSNPKSAYAFVGETPDLIWTRVYRIKCLNEVGLGMELLDDCIPELEDAMRIAETLIMFRFKDV